MPVFFIPPEYFGGVGLSKGIGEAGVALNESADTIRRRRTEDKQAAMQEMAVLRSLNVPSTDPRMIAAAARATGVEGIEARLSPQEMAAEEIYNADKVLQDPTATPEAKRRAQAVRNRGVFGNVVGPEGELTEAEQRLELGGLQVSAAKDEAAERAEYKSELIRLGLGGPGAVKATATNQQLKRGEVEIKDIEAGIRVKGAQVGLIHAQTSNERLQGQLIRAQTNRVNQEIAAARQSVAANDPLAKANLEYYQAAAKDLMTGPNALYLPGGLQQLASGFRQELPREQQAAFNSVLQARQQDQQRLLESKLSESMANGNAQQRAAAQRLRALQDEEKATGRSANISSEARTQLLAAATGMSVREVRGRFWGTSLEIVPAEASPTGQPTLGVQGGPTYNPTQVQAQAKTILSSNGGDYARAKARIEAGRAEADARRPGYTDTLLQQLDAVTPPERRQAAAPARNRQAPATDRPRSAPAPARAAAPAPRYSRGAENILPAGAAATGARQPGDVTSRINTEKQQIQQRISTLESAIAANTWSDNGRRRFRGDSDVQRRTRQQISQVDELRARLARLDRQLERFK